jgi:hypothetical protein
MFRKSTLPINPYFTALYPVNFSVVRVWMFGVWMSRFSAVRTARRTSTVGLWKTIFPDHFNESSRLVICPLKALSVLRSSSTFLIE